MSVRLLTYSSQRLNLEGDGTETTAPLNPGGAPNSEEKGTSLPEQPDDGTSKSAPANETPAK